LKDPWHLLLTVAFAFNCIGKVWVWSCKKRNRGGQRIELDGEEKIEKAVRGREDKEKKKKKKRKKEGRKAGTRKGRWRWLNGATSPIKQKAVTGFRKQEREAGRI